MRIYTIDGRNFSTLEEFYSEIDAALELDAFWGRNLDALNDVLRGGFGTPDEGFRLVWKNSRLSRTMLGFPETVRQLEERLSGCHPESRSQVEDDLARAKHKIGPTVFDWLVEIIGLHCPGGDESSSGVELVLS